MTPNEQKMWYEIAQAMEPYCVNGAGFIYGYVEDPECKGFSLKHLPGTNDIGMSAYYLDSATFPIEEDIRLYQLQKQAEGKGYYDHKTLNWVDPPGTFEGMEDKPE